LPEQEAVEDGRGGLIASAAIIGVGLSGFFDGILLHQILQWHHLLSLVPGETFRDLEVQILADGAFHVLMYLITALGLWLLWRRRRALARTGWRTVAGGGLLGFGIWNIVDVGVFHWILGIHRIRIDVPDPMLYDVAWILILGALPALAAWLLLRHGRSGRHGAAAGIVASLLALVAAPLAALPQGDGKTALVVLRPGITSGAALNAILAADGRIIWANPGGRILAVRFDRPPGTASLYRAGALLVTRSPILTGCVGAYGG
jgi:uncharacterized membrane protein